MSEQPTGEPRTEHAAWVSLLSHESRTPLATVIAATRELCDHWALLGAPQRSALLEIVAQESERLAVLVGGALGEPNGSAALASCDLGAIVETTVSAARLAHPQVALSLDLPPHLPRVLADAFALRQVLTNLIDNAVEHGANGSVELELVIEEERLGVAVRDRGVGIAPSDQQVIFERGGRGAGAVPGARGLGLWISRSIAGAHGGSLEVHSSLGEGSTFTLWLPRAAPDRR